MGRGKAAQAQGSAITGLATERGRLYGDGDDSLALGTQDLRQKATKADTSTLPGQSIFATHTLWVTATPLALPSGSEIDLEKSIKLDLLQTFGEVGSAISCAVNLQTLRSDPAGTRPSAWALVTFANSECASIAHERGVKLRGVPLVTARAGVEFVHSCDCTDSSSLAAMWTAAESAASSVTVQVPPEYAVDAWSERIKADLEACFGFVEAIHCDAATGSAMVTFRQMEHAWEALQEEVVVIGGVDMCIKTASDLHKNHDSVWKSFHSRLLREEREGVASVEVKIKMPESRKGDDEYRQTLVGFLRIFDKYSVNGEGTMCADSLASMMSALAKYSLTDVKLQIALEEIIAGTGGLERTGMIANDDLFGDDHAEEVEHRKEHLLKETANFVTGTVQGIAHSVTSTLKGSNNEPRQTATFEDFAKLCLASAGAAFDPQNLREKFKIFDYDGDESITEDEILLFMEAIGAPVCEGDELTSMWNIALESMDIRDSCSLDEGQFADFIEMVPDLSDSDMEQRHGKELWMRLRRGLIVGHALSDVWLKGQLTHSDDDWTAQWPASLRKRWCFFHPNQAFRVTWDLLMVPIFMQIVIVVPFNIGFDVTVLPLTFEFWTDVTIDVYFIIDVFLNFRTAYYTGNANLETGRCKIASNYLSTWFIIDMVSCAPISYVVLLMQYLETGSIHSNSKAASTASQGNRQAKLVKILRLIRLVKNLAKVAKLKKVTQVLAGYEEYLGALMTGVTLFKLLLVLLLLGHVMACVWYAVGSTDSELSDHTPVYGWVTRQRWGPGVTEKDRYITSFWISLLDVTENYGETTGEKIYGLAQHLIYEGFFGFLVGTFATIVMAGRVSDQLKEEKSQKVREYLKLQKVPLSMRKRMTEYYDHMFEHKAAFSEEEILNELPEGLRVSLVRQVTNNFIKTYGFFSDFNDAVVLQLSLSLRRMPAKEGDIIISKGTTAREMYFILHGCVDTYLHYVEENSELNKWLCMVQDSQFFGEAELMNTCGTEGDQSYQQKLVRRRTIVAKQECDIGVFPYDVMRTLMAEHPLLMKRMRTLSEARQSREQHHMNMQITTLGVSNSNLLSTSPKGKKGPPIEEYAGLQNSPPRRQDHAQDRSDRAAQALDAVAKPVANPTTRSGKPLSARARAAKSKTARTRDQQILAAPSTAGSAGPGHPSADGAPFGYALQGRTILVLATGWRSLKNWQTTLQELLPPLAARGASIVVGVGTEGHHVQKGFPASGEFRSIPGVRVVWAEQNRQHWVVTDAPAKCKHEATAEDAANASNALLTASIASVAKDQRLTKQHERDTVILLTNDPGPGFAPMIDVLTDDVSQWDTACPSYFSSSLQTVVKHAVVHDNSRGSLDERHQIVCIGSHTQSWLPWLTEKFAAAMPPANVRKTTLNTIACGDQTAAKSRVASTLAFVLQDAGRSLHGHVLSA